MIDWQFQVFFPRAIMPSGPYALCIYKIHLIPGFEGTERRASWWQSGAGTSARSGEPFSDHKTVYKLNKYRILKCLFTGKQFPDRIEIDLIRSSKNMSHITLIKKCSKFEILIYLIFEKNLNIWNFYTSALLC